MFVRKFEGDTLDETLSQIKKELGPDAIILKTVTNKGAKGILKKKKIEITAAITEKNYTKKAKVDQVLNTDQKEEFYSGSSAYVANMIDRYDSSPGNAKASNSDKTLNAAGKSYGSVGLNRQVETVKKSNSKKTNDNNSGLDDFLSSPSFEENKPSPTLVRQAPAGLNAAIAEFDNEKLSDQFSEQGKKIDELEARLFEIGRYLEKIDNKGPQGIYQLRSTLKSLDINDRSVQGLIKKALNDLTSTDAENPELVFEFALREMLSMINVGVPLVSKSRAEGDTSITVLLSETSTGQSSTAKKIVATIKDTILLEYAAPSTVSNSPKKSFSEVMHNINKTTVTAISEISSECRKAIENGKSVVIDYKGMNADVNEVKKFVEGLNRAFSNVEVLISISAIHSELYNRKVISRYRPIANGINIAHLDLCLNFGHLFNLGRDAVDLPYMFFSTGESIPDDLEPATAERILSGIFQLN